MKQDILNTEDVTHLVKTFYANLLLHDEVKPIFAHIDFEKHMPHMIAFWEFVLLDKAGYTTNVFDKHVNLRLKESDFTLWLTVFESTIKTLFEGEKVDMAILRTQTIAFTFQQKLKQMGRLN
jgi:hemoglobin